ncbi:hypothetical protein B0T17DRAFT_655130 [Bombardia bombarda]|uniref:Rhodopsin domain-containing protein n=1 Tax=Bombardia bombarda TaxID=252184 RepID=A0AA39X1S4_9PEZI|nr:hypothetical protein B0T17DRAFT_655130 [Bombardia bombarda]
MAAADTPREDVLTTYVSSEAFLAAVVIIVATPGLMVIVRLWSNIYLRKRHFLDDYFAAFAVILLATAGGLYYQLRAINDPTVSITTLGRVISTISFFAFLPVHFSKVPILILYLRVFGVHKVVKVVSWILLVVPFVPIIESSIAIMVGCGPALRAFWTKHVMELSLYSRLHSILTAMRSRSKTSQPSVGSKDALGTSSEHTIDGHSHVEIGEVKTTADAAHAV